MKKDIYIINSNKRLTDDVYEMVLCGDISQITCPGQFINIRIDGHYLRRPISVCDVSRDKSNVKIIYKVVGP